MSIITEAEQFVRTLLTEKLSEDHQYHNLQHTLIVRESCITLAEKIGISDLEKEVLELAALFHDTGFTEVYQGHEFVSCRIAREFLEAHDYPADKLEKVVACIEVTFPPRDPANILDQIIRDADLSNLGNEQYVETTEWLRHEWTVFLNQSFTDKEWTKLNLDFLKNHEYYTSAANEIFVPQKELNLKRLKKLTKKDKKKNKVVAKNGNKKGSTNTESILAGNRSAQMMFKTSLRNHLDLSNLADNKANIMLSVNALIITILMPLTVSSFVKGNTFLMYPFVSLLGTCLGSMIYATLATRPIKMNGFTSEDQILTGGSNLFFFGNFYKMSYPEYRSGMTHVVKDDDRLEDSIMRDLYFLGKSLGTKYRQLRICYTIFMVGIILTVIIFGISYGYSSSMGLE